MEEVYAFHFFVLFVVLFFLVFQQMVHTVTIALNVKGIDSLFYITQIASHVPSVRLCFTHSPLTGSLPR